MDRCRIGDWECPYFEETHGGCCNPQMCPEYQFYKMNEEIKILKEE